MVKPLYVPSEDVLRTCRTCEGDKPETDFSLRPDKKGLKPDCRSCHAKVQYKKYRKGRHTPETRAQAVEASTKSRLKNKYGITPDEYAGMLLLQGGVCAICKSDGGKRKLSVDHNHETGEVRGLLCQPCNTAIGLMKEDPTRLSAAIAYLAESERGF